MHHRTSMASALLAAGSLLAWSAGCKPAACPTTPRTAGGPPATAVPAPASTDPYVAAPLPTTQSVAVDVLWVRTKTDPKTKKSSRSGGMTRVHLLVGPNAQRVSRVGISEQFPGGAGNSWRASVWIAARTAARAVGREIVDYRFLADSEGFIDGPSAGALFTAGFMAALTGAPVRPEVSMTGTVSPDGTVGPVGGLEQKFLAAIGRGKKILGYPEGNKLTKGKGGRMVNLETLAAEQGAKAIPVRDIYEAYQLLTGNAFPGRTPVAKAQLGYDKELALRLLGRAADWRKQHEASVAAASKSLVDPVAKKFYAARIKAAKVYLDASLAAAKGNHPGAAYYSAVRAASWAFTALHFTDIVVLWKQWIALAKKEERTAKAKFMQILLKRRQAMAQAKQAVECKKAGWKTPACRTLRAQRKREAAEQKRLEKLRKLRAKMARKAPPARRPGRPAPRGVAPKAPAGKAPAATVANQPPKVPPEPPQDFQKLLIEKASEMDGKTKAIDRVKADLALSKPATVDQALALISAYAELVQGTAFAIVGKARLQLLQRYKRYQRFVRNAWAKRRMLVQTTNYVDETVKFAGIAFGKAQLAQEMAKLFGAGTRPVSLSEERMKSIANQLFAAAKANLDFIDSLLPKGLRGMMVRRWLFTNSPEYVIARLGMTRSGQLVFKFREAGEQGKHIELGSGYAALGAAVASYMASSKLIAKAFTLGVRHKTSASVTSVRRPIELTNSLHRARMFALEAAYRAQKTTGAVPTFTRILLETADQYRKESLSGQVKALELYWRAALYCQLAEMILRS